MRGAGEEENVRMDQENGRYADERGREERHDGGCRCCCVEFGVVSYWHRSEAEVHVVGETRA